MGWPVLVLGTLGNIVSLSVKLVAPMPTFWRIYCKGTIEQFSADPYVASLMSGSLWLYYGLLTPQGLSIATVSGVGCALQVFYLSVYLWFASRIQRVRVLCLIGLVFSLIGIVVVTTMLLAHATLRIFIVGILSDVTTIVVFISPLTIMGLVLQTKSVEYMPFFLSLFLWVNAGIWMAYGVVVQDLFIKVPYGIGFLLGLSQLILYAIYRRPIKNEADATKLNPSSQSTHELSIEIVDTSTYNNNK